MNNKEWKEYLDNKNKVCKYYGEFAEYIQQNFDPYFGTGIADGEEYNLPQFSVELSAVRRGNCTGYLNIHAKDEEQVRNIIRQQKYLNIGILSLTENLKVYEVSIKKIIPL